MKSFGRLSLLSGLIKLIGIGLAFLFFVISARASNPVDYGIFATLFSAATILGFVFVAGEHISILRYWPQAEFRYGVEVADTYARHSLRKIFTLNAIIVPLFISISACSLLLNIDSAFAKTILSIILGLSFCFSELFISLLRARGEIIYSLMGRDIVWRLLCILLFLCAIYNNLNLDFYTLTAITALTLILVCIGQYLILKKSITTTGSSLPIELIRDTKFSRKWYWISSLVGPISTHSSTIVVGVFVGPIEAGAYFASDRLSKLLSLALISVNQVYGPRVSREFARSNILEVRSLTTKSTLFSLVFSLSGMVIFSVFGSYFMATFSIEYVSYMSLLIILTFGQVVNTACGPMSTLMDMTGQEKQNAMIITVFGSISPPLQIIGALLFSVYGVAYASAFCLAGWSLARIYFCWKNIRVFPISITK